MTKYGYYIVVKDKSLIISNSWGSCVHTVWSCWWGNKRFYIRIEKDKAPRVTETEGIPKEVIERSLKFILEKEYIKRKEESDDE